MVYIPRPGFTPLDPPPVVAFPGMNELRRITKVFIEDDPTVVSLIPVEKVKQPSGGFILEDLPPRPAQRFKLVSQAGGAADGIVTTQDGQARRYEFVLVGEWDATVHIGDFWWEDDDIRWTVQGLMPYNGYEVKAVLAVHGKRPGNG